MKQPHSIIILFIFLFPIISIAIDTITPTKPLTLNQTLVSKNQVFELGFVDTGNDYWYLCIWYKQLEEHFCVWIANRDTPLNSSSSKLTIGENRNLILLNKTETPVWTSNQSIPAVNTVAQLLDSGNFVLRPENDSNPKNYIWESFNHPTDTLLPGMKLGWDRKTGVNRFLTAWKSLWNPGSGKVSFKMNTNGLPEFFLLKGTSNLYRTGPWNGKRFSGIPVKEGESIFKSEFVNNSDEISYSFKMVNSSNYSLMRVIFLGDVQRLTCCKSPLKWKLFWFAPWGKCDEYRKCGPGGVCDAIAYQNISNPTYNCKCMKGFRPKNQQKWDKCDGSDGCVRSSKMNCGSDGFMLMRHMKLPESSKVFVDRTLSLNQCQEICKRNCSCVGYANMDTNGNRSGCVIWVGDLLDMWQYAGSKDGQDLYVRVATSDLGSKNLPFSEESNRKRKYCT